MDSLNLNVHFFPRCYTVLLAESVETGDEIKSYSRSSRTTVTECCMFKALFSLVWHTKMSSVFGTGQFTNSMARIMKANQMSKVCASSHEYPHVEKIQESLWMSKVRWPSQLSQEKNQPYGKKKKPHSKKKKTHSKKNKLAAKRITSRQKKKELKMSSRHRRNFAVSLFLFAVRLILLLWQWWATVQRWGKQKVIG